MTSGFSQSDMSLIRVRDLSVRFAGTPPVHAVNSVSFDLAPGEVLGILGESGSGKSVTLKTLLRLLPERKATITGTVEIDGQDVLSLTGRGLADHRGGIVSMIFQDPSLALDPVYTIGQQIAESVIRHEGASKQDAMARALEMLELVRIPSAKQRLENYPHEMSGGMRQRAMIALALACRPKLLLADEPTTALDATVQIQILLLLRELQQEMGMGVIFVTHDIGVAVEVSDRLAVMYAGSFVETGSVKDVIRDARHPYSKGLLAANLVGAVPGTRLDAVPGAPPPLNALPEGCAFAPRCAVAEDLCLVSPVPLWSDGENRWARCVHAKREAARKDRMGAGN
ncbi:ABC transporter ATP-binding protein [Marivita hallyeonensis]|uniref:Peptide/nickel transport system ATP-binding protein n=1 Tax=Marivita hallyeonensis TaxID=996342 RepID=A0A1M5NXN0_9RHOB|nr:ABC transporter ATP-binding protein [Marivita hallyeonensis]SHG93929.1 peptide/nickel transport system ATP-binding protein [Marivita hallyeonensis]